MTALAINPAAADMEEMVASSPATWHTYVRAYGRIVAEFFTSGGTTTPYYFVGDHLASTVALAGASGVQTEGDAYDAWGRRRNVDGSDESTGCALDPHPASATDRGFTGQEEMDAFCLVNLNARLYDPALGRMLSADPVVSDPLNGQAFDRYSYVTNRPLSFTDPSGYTQAGGTCDKNVPCNPYGGASGNSFFDAGDGSTAIFGGNWYGFMNGGMAGFAGGGSEGIFGDFGGSSGGFELGGSILASPSIQGLGYLATEIYSFTDAEGNIGNTLFGIATFVPFDNFDISFEPISIYYYPEATGGFGHLGISVGGSSPVGFYPAKTWGSALSRYFNDFVGTPGQIKSDSSEESGQPYQKATFAVPSEQAAAVQAFLNSLNDATYEAFVQNCAEIVGQALNAGGITLSNNSMGALDGYNFPMYPDEIFSEVLATEDAQVTSGTLQ